MVLRFAALSSQFATKAAKSPRRRSISGWSRNTAPGAEPRADSAALAGTCHVQEQHALRRRSLRHQVVQARDHPRRRSRYEPVMAAKQGISDVEERLLDDSGLESLASLFPEK